MNFDRVLKVLKGAQNGSRHDTEAYVVDSKRSRDNKEDASRCFLRMSQRGKRAISVGITGKTRSYNVRKPQPRVGSGQREKLPWE